MTEYTILPVPPRLRRLDAPAWEQERIRNDGGTLSDGSRVLTEPGPGNRIGEPAWVPGQELGQPGRVVAVIEYRSGETRIVIETKQGERIVT